MRTRSDYFTPGTLISWGVSILTIFGALGTALRIWVNELQFLAVTLWAIGGAVGGAMIQIGLIAAGVQVGMRASRWDEADEADEAEAVASPEGPS